jgi:hypothetical protein
VYKRQTLYRWTQGRTHALMRPPAWTRRRATRPTADACRRARGVYAYGMHTTRDDRDLEVAAKLARWMDGRMLDPIIGFLVPWGGDVASAAVGLYPVYLAWRRGASKVLLSRMLLNLTVDLLAGSIPFVGDIWDFFFRAHSRNAQLLRDRHLATGVQRSRPRDWLVVIGALLVFLAALSLPIVLAVLAVRALRG